VRSLPRPERGRTLPLRRLRSNAGLPCGVAQAGRAQDAITGHVGPPNGRIRAHHNPADAALLDREQQRLGRKKVSPGSPGAAIMTSH